ncbi:MAG TPA: SdrD B-like domain-containing protein [Vicinamibacteria bacterium]|nr:SdrD B-like domain-containing protein [Vicinamibacteria bacterium]
MSASVTNIVTNPSTQTASVAGRVWLDTNANGVQDIGEPGIANVEVTLKDQFGTPVAVGITDVNGRYLFSGVAPGNGYFAEATGGLPAGTSQTFPVGQSNNRSTTFNLVDGQSYTTADLGYRPAAGTVIFGDQVWVDANGNGLRDPGEVGLGGVSISLYRDSNGNGVYDDGVDALVATTTSAPDGSYSFTGIAAGSTYFVIARTPVDGSSNPYYNPTTATNYRFTNVVAGNGYLTADFGFQPNGTTMVRYTISDRVWFDLNGNGSLDGVETGIAGVTVELLDASSRVIGTTVTASDGTFTFSGVAGGGADYTVSITDTSGILTNYTGTTSYARARERALPNLAASIDFTSTPSFGFRPTRSIGSTIFHDLNGNGVQDPGETGIAGIVVGLYSDANGNGVVDVGDTALGTVTTDANGKYFFAGLTNGSYIVSVPVLTGYTFTGPGTDSDGATPGTQKGATIAGGGDVWTVNFGFRATTSRTLGGTVWNDANANGVIDAGETGYVGVTLNVLSAGSVVATVTTDAAGAYSVQGLAAGTYTVVLTDANGVLTGTSSTYEKTEGTTPPFNYQEVVNLSAADVTNVNFGFRRAQVTFASVASFRAYLSGGSVVVEWRTSLEVGTAGFHVLRLNPSSGRYRRVDERPVPGLVVHPQGGTYRLRDVGAPTEGPLTYEVVELDIHGGHRTYGPYTVAVDREGPDPASDARWAASGSPFERRPATVSRASAARLKASAIERMHPPLRRRTGQGAFLDVTTRDEGLHYLSAVQMAGPLGLSPAGVTAFLRSGRLALSHRGQPTPYAADALSTGIYFYAEPVRSIYTAENVYQVAFGPALPMGGVASTGGLASDFSFQETVHLEQDAIPVPFVFNDPDADFCVWAYLYVGDSWPVTVPAAGVAGTGSASLTVHLVGATDNGTGIDHHVTVTFNDKQVGETIWGGIGRHDLEIPLDPADVHEGDNTLELKVLDGGDPLSIVMLDSVDLSYARTYRAAGDTLTFTAPGGTTVEVSGFSSPNLFLLDVTTPASPALVVGYSADPAGDGSYTLHFGTPADGASRRYLAVRRDLVKAPVAVVAGQSGHLRSSANRARYVLVAPDTLEAAAGVLADYRNSRGISTTVVGLGAIYDEFNGGIAEPTAIREFLRYATSHWAEAPRYAALVGRGTWDYKNVDGYGDNLVPPLLAASADGLFASDVRMADLAGDDGVPEIALGRIPVLTSQELLDYVAKVEAQEGAGSADWTHAVLMAADNPDGAGAFTTDSDAVAALLPSDRLAEKVYLTTTTAGAGKQAIVDALEAGVSIFNYIGHGSPVQLADEDLFDNAEVASLVNPGRLPVFVAMTCSAGDFAIPGFPSLAETLLLKKDGGAVAAWAPSGLSRNDLAVRLDKSFFQSAFAGDGATIGDIVVRGLGDLVVPDAAPERYMYNLLGEPVSRVPQ